MQKHGQTQEDIDGPEWLTMEQVADRSKQSLSTIYTWRSEGYFPAYVKLRNGRILVHSEDLESWLLRQRVAA